MNAPILWIAFPILIGVFSLALLNVRAMTVAGAAASVVLAALALILPIDEAVRIGPISIKVASSASVLGRSLVLPAAESPLLVMIFGICAFWFAAAEAAGAARRLIPFGLIIAAMLVASIAVQPFLFASVLIEMAVLVAVPMLSPPERRPSQGVIRFLIYQTLGMPFILFAGWLLAGVETSPGDLALTVQSTIMLGLGFAFLLAIFPLYDWIPQLMEDCEPYLAGFLMWILPSTVVVFGLSFLDRYAWLRTSPDVITGLRDMGLIMLISGGLWAAVQRHIGRIMAYASIAETGFLLLAMSLVANSGAKLVFMLLIARGLTFALWSLSLSVFKGAGATLQLASLEGLARRFPWAGAGLILAGLSTAGFPLLAGFLPRLALWEGLAQQSPAGALWFLAGLSGLMIAVVRQMRVLLAERDEKSWSSMESLIQREALGAGILGLFFLGVVPQAVGFVTEKLPLMYLHFGR